MLSVWYMLKLSFGNKLNFREVQIESICRWQIKFNSEVGTCLGKDRKHFCKWGNAGFQHFHLYHNVFRSALTQDHKSGLCGKELILPLFPVCITVNPWVYWLFSNDQMFQGTCRKRFWKILWEKEMLVTNVFYPFRGINNDLIVWELGIFDFPFTIAFQFSLV